MYLCTSLSSFPEIFTNYLLCSLILIKVLMLHFSSLALFWHSQNMQRHQVPVYTQFCLESQTFNYLGDIPLPVILYIMSCIE